MTDPTNAEITAGAHALGRLAAESDQPPGNREIAEAVLRAARTVGGKSCGCVEALEDLYRQRAVEFVEPIDDFDRGVTRGIELAADHLRVW